MYITVCLKASQKSMQIYSCIKNEAHFFFFKPSHDVVVIWMDAQRYSLSRRSKCLGGQRQYTVIETESKTKLRSWCNMWFCCPSKINCLGSFFIPKKLYKLSQNILIALHTYWHPCKRCQNVPVVTLTRPLGSSPEALLLCLRVDISVFFATKTKEHLGL